MGSKISIDKHVSQLDDILHVNPKELEKINLQSNIQEDITQNIKIWRFYEEDSKTKKILNSPISLQNLQNSNFSFLSKECYVVLVVYRRSKDQDSNTFVSFPHSMWGIVESYNNLTPRGLENPLSTSELNLEILDSFLLPNHKKEKISLNFQHMIFVWNGKTSNPLIKSLALSSAYNLESLIEKGKENILEIFFSGGVIEKNKLKSGKVIQLNSTSNKPHNTDLEKEINKMSQSIFLFKFLFPLNSSRGNAAALPSINGESNQMQDNQTKNQNWVENNEEGYQDGTGNSNYNNNGLGNNNGQIGRGNQYDNNNQNGYVYEQNGYNNQNNQENNQMQAENEQQQQDEVNQQQFYSSSSVDSNTTAASETHYLKFFRKQFCESTNNNANNYINNFIRVPPSSKKSGQSKRMQEAKLGNNVAGTYDNQNMQECEYNQQIPPFQQQQQEMFQGQDQYIPQQGEYLQQDPEIEYNNNRFDQNMNINHNNNEMDYHNNDNNNYQQFEYENQQEYNPYQQQQQQHQFQQQPISAPGNKKGISMKLNLAGIPKNNNNGYNLPQPDQGMNYQGGFPNMPNQGFQNMGMNINLPGQQQFQEFRSPNQEGGVNNNYEGNAYQNGEQQDEEKKGNFNGDAGEPTIYCDFDYRDMAEEPSEKSQHPFKINFGMKKNSKNPKSHRNTNNEDPNSPESSHADEVQDEVRTNIRLNGISGISANRDNGYGAPPQSTRGNYGPNQTSNSIMAELMKKKQLKLGPLNGQITSENSGEEQIVKATSDSGIGLNLKEIRSMEISGQKISTNLMIKEYAKICSEIIPKFMYVSGEDIAYNRDVLQQNGITHIINCAGDVCKNPFPNDFTYKTYRLKDAKTENIECIFYDTIKFVEEVAKSGGRVFIHCVQGISRSVTLCIAYKMWKDGSQCSFQEAFTYVKEMRHVASPNAGFIVQLINFHKRLYSNYDSISVRPRVWCVCSHQQEQPELVVAKMLLEGLYQNPNYLHTKLDPRGAFIIQSPDKLYIWIGSEIPTNDAGGTINRRQAYIDYSREYIKALQTYEHSPEDVVEVQQGEESDEFWQMWFPQKPQDPYQFNKEMNNWFLDLSPIPNKYLESKDDYGYYYDDEDDRRDDDQGSRAKLFIYPESSPIGVFEWEDLMEQRENGLCILCREQEDRIIVHIWKGTNFAQIDKIEEYKNEIIQAHYPNHAENQDVIHEIIDQESEEFFECFDSR